MPRDWTTQLVTSYSVEIKKGRYILYGIIFYIILVHLIHISKIFREADIIYIGSISTFLAIFDQIVFVISVVSLIGNISYWHMLIAVDKYR